MWVVLFFLRHLLTLLQLTLEGDAVICLPSNEHVVLPLSRLSLYRDIEDYHWDGMDGPVEEPLDGALSDGDMIYEDEWDAPEVDDRNDWSYMEIDEGGHPPEPDDMVDVISPKPVTPIFGNNTIMPGTFPSSPPSPSYANSDSEFRVSSSSPETKVAGSPRRNS